MSQNSPGRNATSNLIHFGILGARGRMGQWVGRLIQSEFSKQATVTVEVNRSEPLSPLLKSDVVIDFSNPAAMLELAKLALAHEGPIPAFVIGSTGWNLNEHSQPMKTLHELADKTPVLMATNFSVGVFILSEILKRFTPILEKQGYTPVLTETHHCHKKDAPSGTAITLQRSMDPKAPDRIQTHSIRAGEVIGDHEVTFFGPADRLTLSHSAQDRSIFSRGAIEVALWLAGHRKSTGSHQRNLKKGILGMDSYFDALL